VNLIKLRNPYGNDVGYTNAYADGSTSWAAVPLAEQLRIGYINNTSDGVFFVTKE
jgi:hypothetical protein